MGNKSIWVVQFDDGDAEDPNAKELGTVLYDDRDRAGVVMHDTSVGQTKPQHHMATRGSISIQPAHGSGAID